MHQRLTTTAVRGREGHLTVPELAFDALFFEYHGSKRSEGGKSMNKAEEKNSTEAEKANTLSTIFPLFLCPV